ncbi:methyltransferase domain-containing protein [bacterium]|nr:methyltransferase domain-containing protein [bacterium]
MGNFLHVGCGQNTKSMTTRGFNSPEWSEIRLDIDSNVDPDIIGSMTDMSAVATESVDALFSSHNIEHLYPHEIPLALNEFLRVLKPEGFAVITCPDLQSVSKLIAEDKLAEPAYQSPAGPIAPLDILYGYRPAMAAGNLFMAHRTGFTKRTLIETLLAAGFKQVGGKQRSHYFDLWAIASKADLGEKKLLKTASEHFPI